MATLLLAPGLRYVNDAEPGIRRRRRGRGFEYRAPDDTRVTDEATLQRIRSLAIPPAWHDVWICPDPRGHIQATGRDDRERKQYRYHPDWREMRDRHKFDKLVPFGDALPAVRRIVARDLELPGLPRERVLATIVRLLELTRVRVGNEEYARTNGSFGLTTLRRKHVETSPSQMRFVFPGKSGVLHEVDAEDRRVARVLRKCEEIPGQRLFRYVDDDGSVQPVHSHDVNDYLREAAGFADDVDCEITAKDFRTWLGTASAAAGLAELEVPGSDAAARRAVNEVLTGVAEELGNTLAVCRASYVHPAVLEGFTTGALQDAWVGTPRAPRGLFADERRLLRYLRAGDRKRLRAAG